MRFASLSSWLGGLREQAASHHACAHPAGELGTLLPFAPHLEEISGRYQVWRARESEKELARKAALAICERIEERVQEIAAMERDLDAVLTFDRWPYPRKGH